MNVMKLKNVSSRKLKFESRVLFRVLLTLFVIKSPAQGALVWSQLGGTSGTSGSGGHVNSFLASPEGSAGAANFVANGTILSFGTVSDGTSIVDYVVDFKGGSNPARAEPVNNSFIVNANGTADFFTASQGNIGTEGNGSGLYSDNGSFSIGFRFFASGTYDPISDTGTAVLAQVGVSSVNVQPDIYTGGNAIVALSSNEFYDFSYGSMVSGTVSETDTLNQIQVYNQSQASGLTANGLTTTLVTYDTGANSRPIGITPTLPQGTSGFVDALTGDLRLEFETRHDVVDANWEVQLPSQHSFEISRPGDPGNRSGIGFTGDLGPIIVIPEPSTSLLVILGGLGALTRRKRTKVLRA